MSEVGECSVQDLATKAPRCNDGLEGYTGRAQTMDKEQVTEVETNGTEG